MMFAPGLLHVMNRELNVKHHSGRIQPSSPVCIEQPTVRNITVYSKALILKADKASN